MSQREHFNQVGCISPCLCAFQKVQSLRLSSKVKIKTFCSTLQTECYLCCIPNIVWDIGDTFSDKASNLKIKKNKKKNNTIWDIHFLSLQTTLCVNFIRISICMTCADQWSHWWCSRGFIPTGFQPCHHSSSLRNLFTCSLTVCFSSFNTKSFFKTTTHYRQYIC